MDIYFSNDDVRTNVLKTPISVCSMQEQIYFINSKHSFIGNIHLSLCGERSLSVCLFVCRQFPIHESTIGVRVRRRGKGDNTRSVWNKRQMAYESLNMQNGWFCSTPLVYTKCVRTQNVIEFGINAYNMILVVIATQLRWHADDANEWAHVHRNRCHWWRAWRGIRPFLSVCFGAVSSSHRTWHDNRAHKIDCYQVVLDSQRCHPLFSNRHQKTIQ